MQQHLSRLARSCTVCKLSEGALISCSHRGCDARFHPLCGWLNGMQMTMAVDAIDGTLKSTAICSRHTPRRNLSRFRFLRSQGLTQSTATAAIHRKERQLSQLIVRDPEVDVYMPSLCAICFEQRDDEQTNALLQCISCDVNVHRACYESTKARIA